MIDGGDDPAEAFATHVGGWLVALAAGRPQVSLALSGGASPWPAFEQLVGRPDVPWDRIDVYQVDERLTASARDRNITGLQRIFEPVGARLHPIEMPADPTTADPDAIAATYAAHLPRRLDVVHLGLGADGHTASLFADDPALERSSELVAATGPHGGWKRITLTLAALDRAGHIVWYVTGEDKRAALARLEGGDGAVPAARVERSRAVVITDLPGPDTGEAPPGLVRPLGAVGPGPPGASRA